MQTKSSDTAFSKTQGIKKNGEKLSSINYADNKVLIAETFQQLPRMIRRPAMESEKYRMRINVSKTKVMQITRSRPIRSLEIVAGGGQLKEVQTYQYLGYLITSDPRDDKETVTRMDMARNALKNLEHIIRDQKMCYVWSIMRYASKTWKIPKRIQNKMNIFEMWCLRRLHRIGWTEKITDEEILQGTGLQQKILFTVIGEAKKKFLGAKLKNDETLRTVTQGKTVEKTPRGRRRLTANKIMMNYE